MIGDTVILLQVAGGILLVISLSGLVLIWPIGKRFKLQQLYKLAGSSQAIAQAAISMLFIFISMISGDSIQMLLTLAGICSLVAFVLAATQFYIDSIV